MRKAILGLVATLLTTPAAAHADCTYRSVPDLQYGTGKLEGGKSMPLYLDAYIPETCNGMLVREVPPVGVIHGGAFRVGSRKDPAITKLAIELAKQGFATFSIEYRMEGDKPVLEDSNAREFIRKLYNNVTPKEYEWITKHASINGPQKPLLAMVATEDALKAKEWVNAHQERFNIQTRNWGLIGGSAGAATALQLAYTGDDIFKKPQDTNAVVDLWGNMYPKTYIDNNEANLLIVHGTKDPVVEYQYSTELLEAAKKAGLEAHRITVEGAGHGFGSIDIFTEKVAGTNATIFEAITAFFDQQLRQ